jgi:GMP synthase (glutamine-hydrolyzing), N-terminal domain or A subunit
VLVVDFGAQYAQLIARRVREAQVYSEIVPHTASVAELLERDPAAIVLSGGPASVYADGAPRVDPELFDARVPVLGICYGFQAMADALGGTVEKTGTREYGRTELETDGGALHRELPRRGPVWMSHGDSVTAAPGGFAVTARSAGSPVAGFEDTERRLAGVQYHPEVVHSPHGQEVLRRFLHDVAGIRPSWTTANVVVDTVDAIRSQVGAGLALCGLSGGVDSAVAAALVHRGIGDRLTCVFVDHGLLRAGERTQVERDYVAATGVRLVTVDARDRFLDALAGVADPEEKRKIIGREFIRVFEAAALDLQVEAGEHGRHIDFLVQGTLYPDVVESGGGSGTANIKSHHNVGGLPEDLAFGLVEPLRTLFKDEVRRVGLELGLPETIVHRQPFPARPGDPDHRRGHREPAGDAARSGCDRPRGAHRGGTGPRHLAVPGGAARGGAQRGRAGRRADLRPPGGAAPGVQRGRDDRGLVPAAGRGAGPHLESDHQRGARGEPGGARRHEQAPGTIEWE